MNIIFTSMFYDSKQVDPCYQTEYDEAKNLYFGTNLISYEKIGIKNNIFPEDSLIKTIYRSWMMTPDNYTWLYNDLMSKNIQLINSPEQYLNCHYFPESYNKIKDYTAKTVWLPIPDYTNIDFNQIMELLKVFNGKPVVMKDYVKSQKNRWLEACYIPDSSNELEVRRVIGNFFDGTVLPEMLNVGLVFREYIEFEHNGLSKSGQPKVDEVRLFFINSQFFNEQDGDKQCNLMWQSEIPLVFLDDTSYYNAVEKFKEVAKTIDSNFFSMDIAKGLDSQWYIVEVGDGCVSGLPENMNSTEAKTFYDALKKYTFESGSYYCSKCNSKTVEWDGEYAMAGNGHEYWYNYYDCSRCGSHQSLNGFYDSKYGMDDTVVFYDED